MISILFELFTERIINVSSVMCRYSAQRESVYHLSKAGVESMSDSLRLEMRALGVGVSIIEPGKYDAATTCSDPEIVICMHCIYMYGSGVEGSWMGRGFR